MKKKYIISDWKKLRKDALKKYKRYPDLLEIKLQNLWYNEVRETCYLLANQGYLTIRKDENGEEHVYPTGKTLPGKLRAKTRLKRLFHIPITKKDCLPGEWEKLEEDAKKYSLRRLEKWVKRGYTESVIDPKGGKLYLLTRKGARYFSKKYPELFTEDEYVESICDLEQQKR